MPAPDFEAFVKAQVLSTQRAPSRSAPPLQRCLAVTAIAPRSPAAHAGVEAGDLLTSLNGESAGMLDPKLYRKPARQRSYVFYSARTSQRTQVVASGIDPGLELQLTPEAISAGYKPASGDPTPLLALWEARAWAPLEKLSGEALRLRGNRDTPALLLQGAALFEQARFDQGIALVIEYLRNYVSHWTQDYQAVAAYYVAMKKRMEGDAHAAIELLRDAFLKAPLPRLAEALASLGEPRPEPPTFWLRRKFPVPYSLASIEGAPRTHSLAEALARLAPGTLFLVCLLDGYRANGPYNDFMWRFSEYAAHFQPFLGGMHVITEVAERRPDRAHWFAWEDRARAAGAPFEVLLDSDGAVGAALQPPGSPFVVALDRHGSVHGERELEGVALWKALAAANVGPSG
jgi:hypothetical protein